MVISAVAGRCPRTLRPAALSFGAALGRPATWRQAASRCVHARSILSKGRLSAASNVPNATSGVASGAAPPLPPTPARDPSDKYYTAYHFQPLKNWMNDPNGRAYDYPRGSLPRKLYVAPQLPNAPMVIVRSFLR